ncbi:MAG: hypothetical protein J1E35_05245 [Lachnospiraceae bacterium]|nr:hypothetical protein [Lachnospiraceae bacterium]
MKTQKAANGILAVFFTIMLLLTLFAEDLYRLTLPKVVTETVLRRPFPYEKTDMEGNPITVEQLEVAVPLGVLTGNRVYVLIRTESGTFVREREVTTGKIESGYIEITEGLRSKDKIVVGSDRALTDGAEVLETEWNEQILLHGQRETQPEKEISSPYFRNGMRNNVCYAVGIAVITAVLVFLCKKFLKRRLRFLQTPVLILWCVLVCFFLRKNLVIPGEWIPEKLIDWNGWKENIKQFRI